MLDSVDEVSGSEKENVNDEENNEFNAGSDNGSVNNEVNQTDQIANLLSQATQASATVHATVPGKRIYARLQGGTQVEVVHHSSAQRRPRGDVELADFSMDNQNPTPGKRTRKRRPTPDYQNLRCGKCLRTTAARFVPSSLGCAPDNDYSLPVMDSSILFPIRVTREKWNCALGNTVNLLTYINHFNTGLKQKMLSLGAQKMVVASKRSRR
jgi:hypothetical protein